MKTDFSKMTDGSAEFVDLSPIRPLPRLRNIADNSNQEVNLEKEKIYGSLDQFISMKAVDSSAIIGSFANMHSETECSRNQRIGQQTYYS